MREKIEWKKPGYHELEARLRMIANIAHRGSLIGYDNIFDAVCEIRKISLPGRSKNKEDK